MAGKRRPGRPSKLTVAVRTALVSALENGCYREAAIRAAGIGTTTFQRWMEKGEHDEEADEDSPHRELRAAVIQAEAVGEVNAVQIIRTNASDGHWQAAAWFLERKYPDRWGRRDRFALEAAIQANVQMDVEVVHNRVVQVIPDATRRDEVAAILAEAMGVNGDQRALPSPN